MELDRIGPYLIDHKIGSGGMGTVYLAQHAETGQEAAVKVLPPELAREEGFVVRFEREIESLRKLINPYVVALLDSGVDQNTYYYAMEYIEGETLTDRLRRDKRLPWRDVVRHGLQICSALKSAHDAGIIHRDLKPSNLLLDKDNTVKLTDFGVAQVFASGRLTVTGGIIGTAEYMSPEQAKGQRATKKSDLYSLGAVMYMMLTGRPPFVGKTTLEVIQKHKYGQFDRPGRFVEGLPRRLEETICQLLEKNPDKRFPDALVLSRKLEEILRRAEAVQHEETRIAHPQATGRQAHSATVRMRPDSEADEEAGGGTLMRDLLRADLEQSQAGSLMSRLLNNTWVLVGLLLLIIGGGIAWFQKMGDGGTESVASNRSEENRRLTVAKTKLLSHLRSSPLDKTDPFVRQAVQAVEAGDLARAERVLVSLNHLIEGEDGYDGLKNQVNAALDEIRSAKELRTPIDESSAIAKQLAASARRLRKQGEIDSARAIWQTVIDLYAEDPACQPEVAEARRRLRDTAEQSLTTPASKSKTPPDGPPDEEPL